MDQHSPQTSSRAILWWMVVNAETQQAITVHQWDAQPQMGCGQHCIPHHRWDVYSTASQPSDVVSTALHPSPQMGCLQHCIPHQGLGPSQRRGRKIEGPELAANSVFCNTHLGNRTHMILAASNLKAFFLQSPFHGIRKYCPSCQGREGVNRLTQL